MRSVGVQADNLGEYFFLVTARKLIWKVLLPLLTLTASGASYAQAPAVSARLDSAVLTIGDQTILHLRADFPQAVLPEWPFFPDTLGKIEILERSRIDTVRKHSRLLLHQALTITCFDSGYFPIPPFSFYWKNEGDTTVHTLETEALLLTVHGMVVDTTRTIKDIKQPLEISLTWWEWLWEYRYYILALFIVAAIGAVTYLLLKKKKKASPEEKIIIKNSHEVALELLRQLDAEKQWQQGRVKLYYTRLSDIMRTYIERRFNINAPEQTTGEILDTLSRLPLPEAQLAPLQQLLVLSDMVKFAKAAPLPDEHGLSMANAVEFVKSTIPGGESGDIKNNSDSV